MSEESKRIMPSRDRYDLVTKNWLRKCDIPSHRVEKGIILFIIEYLSAPKVFNSHFQVTRYMESVLSVITSNQGKTITISTHSDKGGSLTSTANEGWDKGIHIWKIQSMNPIRDSEGDSAGYGVGICEHFPFFLHRTVPSTKNSVHPPQNN